MKKLILSMILLFGFSHAQFKIGTISAGTLLNYSVYNPTGEGGNAYGKAVVGSQTIIYQSIKPTISYFVKPNLSVDGLVGRTSITYKGDKTSQSLIGGGLTYYLGMPYIGGSFIRMNSDTDLYNSSSNDLEFHGGYLYNIVENVYLDIGISYLFGIGNTEFDYGSETTSADNNEKLAQVSLGIKAYFSR